MKDGFLYIDGTRIYYTEKNSSAAYSLFLIHGNSASHRTWRKQWDDPLFDAFRLVSIDLPAHGQSAAAPDPIAVYNLPALGAFMAQAVRQLAGNKPYFIAGVSLATNIITEMLPFGIGPLGLILAGPCIVGQEVAVGQLMKPDTHVSVVFEDEPAPEDIKSFGQEISNGSAEDLALFLDDFYQVKGQFRSLLGQSIGNHQYSDEISLLRQHALPTQLIFGKDEKVVRPDYLDTISLPIWNERIVKIPGASHLVQVDQPAAFNTAVYDFMQGIFKRVDF